MRELAETLGVHVRTVQSWHKDGMSAVDEQDRPYLFMGQEAKIFLRNRQLKKRRKLSANEIFCLACSDGVTPDSRTVSLDLTDRRLGRKSKLVIIRAKCPQCGRSIIRFASQKSVSKTIWQMNAGQAGKGL